MRKKVSLIYFARSNISNLARILEDLENERSNFTRYTMFNLYFTLGMQHILDTAATDHQAYLIAISVLYGLKDYKKIIFLITAFTIGHSIALAASTLEWVSIPVKLVETAIPITIILAALFNISPLSQKKEGKVNTAYLITIMFGLIHGLGFSNYLKELLNQSSEGILMPLLGFNLGVECAQLIIVPFVLFAGYLVKRLFRLKQEQWKILGSGIALGMAITIFLS